MAVASSTSATAVSAKDKESKEAKKRSQLVDDVCDNGNKAKRSRCPGVRVVGNRIYDSVNGKSCHQVIPVWVSNFPFPLCLADEKLSIY
jgi:hypothetical protein